MKNDDQQAGKINVEWRGRERYAETWERQLGLHQQRRAGECGDQLIFVEHEPVITLGRQGELSNLLTTEEQLREHGIDFHKVERGGDITFHGPGQLVGYPIIDLRDRDLSVRELMRGLEEGIILTLAEYGLATKRIPGLTGVWHTVDAPTGPRDEKLAALGVAVRGGVSFHGLALNVDPDLSYFSHIVPCGIEGKQVASLATTTGQRPELADVARKLAGHLAAYFGYLGCDWLTEA